jgi:hypothetical protein
VEVNDGSGLVVEGVGAAAVLIETKMVLQACQSAAECLAYLPVRVFVHFTLMSGYDNRLLFIKP